MYHIQSRLTMIGPQASLSQRTLLLGDKGTLHKAHLEFVPKHKKSQINRHSKYRSNLY